MSTENTVQLMAACFGGSLQKLIKFIYDDSNLVFAQDKDGNTTLIVASMNGKTAVIRVLLDTFADQLSKSKFINTQSANGNTALIEAGNNGWADAVEMLLDNGAFPNIQNSDGDTALIVAADYDHKLDVMRLLLDGEASVDVQNKEGITALIRATCNGNVAAVKLLLERRANLKITSDEGRTAFDEADERGLREIRDLLSEAAVRSDNTDLMLAAGNGNVKRVIELLKDSTTAATIDFRNEHDGFSALTYAITKRHDGVVDALLKAGARVTDEERVFLIKQPKRRRNKEVVGYLISSFEPSSNALTGTDTGVLGGPQMSPENVFWMFVLTDTKDAYTEELTILLDRFPDRISSLANRSNKAGIRAVDMATPKYRELLLNRMVFYARYELHHSAPVYASDDVIVRHAVDHNDVKKPTVALHFYRMKSHFMHELSVRLAGKIHGDYLLPLLRYHDSDDEAYFRSETVRKGFFPYCTVHPSRERTLLDVVLYENFVGRDWTLIRQIMTEVTQAVAQLHSKGLVHGGLSPISIVRDKGRFKLVSMGSVARITLSETIYTSLINVGYAAPEVLITNTDVANQGVVGSVQTFELHPSPLAHHSFDLWGLGALCYLLCTGEALVHTPFSYNSPIGLLDTKVMKELYDWSDSTKEEKLARITNVAAQQLVASLLMKEPSLRLNADGILSHPFILPSPASASRSSSINMSIHCNFSLNSDDLAELDHQVVLFNEVQTRNLLEENKLLLKGISNISQIVNKLSTVMDNSGEVAGDVNQLQLPAPTNILRTKRSSQQGLLSRSLSESFPALENSQSRNSTSKTAAKHSTGGGNGKTSVHSAKDTPASAEYRAFFGRGLSELRDVLTQLSHETTALHSYNPYKTATTVTGKPSVVDTRPRDRSGSTSGSAQNRSGSPLSRSGSPSFSGQNRSKSPTVSGPNNATHKSSLSVMQTPINRTGSLSPIMARNASMSSLASLSPSSRGHPRGSGGGWFAVDDASESAAASGSGFGDNDLEDDEHH